MNIEPRYDVWRDFNEPDKVAVQATGVIGGQLRTMAVILRDDDPHYCADHDALIENVRPLLKEWWHEALEEAAA